MNARIVVSARGVRSDRPPLVCLACAPLAAVALAFGTPLSAQQAPQAQADPSRLTVERIYASTEFRSESFGPARWLPGGAAFTTVERAANGPGRDIVRYDAETGAREVLVPATQLVPPGGTLPLEIENYFWSPDLSRALIFSDARPVWRTNSRGDYWVLDRASGRLRKLGGPQAKPSTLMFAKFSPDGARVGYVREFNLYVEDLATGRIAPLTRDGSRTVINGTFDWVYEEELMDYWADGWRWSPDGRSIAYWQLDANGVRDYTLLNTTDSLYSYAWQVQYPKAGERNSAARIGVVSASGGATRWMQVPGDPRGNYIARMEWAPAGDAVLIQQLNRLQNRLLLFAADPRSRAVRLVTEESHPGGWVDADTAGPWAFLAGGRSLIWMSERSGWRHWYAQPLDGSPARPVTQGAFDAKSRVMVDTTGGWLYYVASPDNPAQHYLFRTRLDGTGQSERLTPTDQPGYHQYSVAPTGRFAVHTSERFGVPPVTDIVMLPDHRVVRTLVDNAPLRQRLAALRRGTEEFFTVDAGGGVRLTGWMLRPPDFDPSRRYPMLVFLYGGPSPNIQNATVVDRWPLGSGGSYPWFTMLAQQGYLVASLENRGTGLHGRDWRQATYGQLGVLESDDLANGVRAMRRQWPWIDSARVGIYGHSYGGFMALNAILRYPDVFSTAISAAPVTDWRFYDTIYTERYHGLPQDNAAGYQRGSPITYAANLRGNLLLVHGTGDDNVHVQNSEAMVNALVRAQRQFSLMVYPNRNHRIATDGAERHRFELYTRFLEERLPPGGH